MLNEQIGSPRAILGKKAGKTISSNSIFAAVAYFVYNSSKNAVAVLLNTGKRIEFVQILGKKAGLWPQTSRFNTKRLKNKLKKEAFCPSSSKRERKNSRAS